MPGTCHLLSPSRGKSGEQITVEIKKGDRLPRCGDGLLLCYFSLEAETQHGIMYRRCAVIRTVLGNEVPDYNLSLEPSTFMIL